MGAAGVRAARRGWTASPAPRRIPRVAFEGLPPAENHALLVHHPEIALQITPGVIVAPFRISEEPPIVLRYGKRVRGTVKNEFDVPIAGARLHLDARWIPSAPRASLDRLSATTDENGRYEILGIPDGTRCLTAEAPDMGTLTRTKSLIFADKTGQAHVVDFTLRFATQLAGRVVDPVGAGVGGATVFVVDPGAHRDVPNSRTVTAPDGTFSIPAVQPGTYRLRAAADGFAETVQEGVLAPGGDDLTLILVPRPMIRGSVVSAATGEPLSDFSLRLRHLQNVELASVPVPPQVEFRGASNGEFWIPAMGPAGSWLVEATSPGYAPTYSNPFESSADSSTEGIVVALTRGGTIRGRLVDESGAPVAGGRVTSRDNDWVDDALSRAMGDSEPSDATTSSARSDSNGGFSLSNLHAATYQLVLEAPGYHQRHVPGVELAEGASLDLDAITLQAGATLRGTLYDAESSPVAGGVVFLQPSKGGPNSPTRRTKTGGDGTWSLADITPGTHFLSARPPTPGVDVSQLWPSPQGEELVLKGGSEDVRDVHLRDWTMPVPPPPRPPTGQVGGKVLGPDGAGRVGVAIELTPQQAGLLPSHSSKSGRDGEFSILGVLPGAYELHIVDQPESRASVNVFADQWARHDLRLDE
jgi:hypothetical protein